MYLLIKRVASAISLAAGFLIVCLAPIAPARALAASCPTAVEQDGYYWAPSDHDVTGIRAPILLRTDTLLCSDTGSAGSLNTTWIAIQDAPDIAQIGVIRHYTADGSREWCRVWATGIGVPTFYDCSGSATDHTYIYFLINFYIDPQLNIWYNLQDCGTDGDFDNCTSENRGQAVFTTPTASVESEAHEACTTRIAGANSDRQFIGNSSWDLMAQNSSGWFERSWTAAPYLTTCGPSDYARATTSDGVSFWDTRNGG